VKPLPRSGHVSVTTEDRIIMFVSPHSPSTLVIISCRFGGVGDHRQHFYNDTWSFDISTRKWTELKCTGSIPSPRACHAAVLVDDVMYVFGGYAGNTYLDDLVGLRLSSE
jgi:Galactose oxidase, central domain